MRKWLLIFLLLLNVIVFFGFAMRGQETPARPDVEVEQAFELRLVSEVAPDSLIKIAEQPEQRDIQAWFVEGACIAYEGIKEQKSADDIAGFMAEQGLSPIILMQTVTAEKYQMVVTVPDEREARLTLESRLQANGITLIMANINDEAVYLIGSYASAGEAENAQRGLLSVSSELQLHKVLDTQRAFSVQLADDVDRNLINKINDVLKLTYETLKIEKKVCKGLASTKPHQ
ncbi:hypothetical protein [Neptunomonas qingdaonensis]|uniref:Uncharacterized protein n=1 Tax=Neptunomonas qingdaonensis TaxID=1045558 RepID=A0A1I2VPX9_9GAMM|nr:hypothetical protein [Neptunomonas qingdaonensis]SFG91374.1 hypothetical protein SAMN05216175_11860 [Neptunomonas qingdaonensis]